MDCVSSPTRTVFSTPVVVQTINQTITSTITVPGAEVTETVTITECLPPPEGGNDDNIDDPPTDIEDPPTTIEDPPTTTDGPVVDRRVRRQESCRYGTTQRTTSTVRTGESNGRFRQVWVSPKRPQFQML